LIGRADVRARLPPGKRCRPAARRGARAEARGCAAGQGDALRESNHRTHGVLSVIHHARIGGRPVQEMARIAVWPISHPGHKKLIMCSI